MSYKGKRPGDDPLEIIFWSLLVGIIMGLLYNVFA